MKPYPLHVDKPVYNIGVLLSNPFMIDYKLGSRAINKGFLAIAVGALLLVGATTTVSAVERTLTLSTLKSAYTTQVGAIDEQIATLTAEVEVLQKAKPHTPNAAKRLGVSVHDNSFKAMATKGKIQKLQEDKHTLEVAYGLLTEAFK